MTLFAELIKQPTDQWSRSQLEQLTIAELKTLCRLVGISYNKNYKHLYVEHLLKQAQIQRIVREFWQDLEDEVTNDQINNLAAAYKFRELRDMCRAVGTYAPGTKYGMASSLISWNRQCIRSGRQFYQAQLAIVRSQPRQLALKLF